MKIERLTEDKIRIIIKQDELKDPSLDLHTIMTKAAESQGLFLEILAKAKKETGFNADGHKLLIEAFNFGDDSMVFTITKYKVLKNTESEKVPSNSTKKTLRVKRKHSLTPVENRCIYRFIDFETFCDFCNNLNKHTQISRRGLIKDSSLYLYNNLYFLVISGINLEHKSLIKFHSLLSEFSTISTTNKYFENKLKEHGKIVIKKSAINVGIKYFSN